jgi:cellobiose transport system permease protein
MEKTTGKKIRKNYMITLIKPVILYAVLIGLGIIFLFPFWFMFIGIFRTNSEIYSTNLRIFPERGFTDFHNLKSIYDSGFFINLRVTLFVSLARTLANLFFCTLAGYAFSKMRFKYKQLLFYFMVFTMMVPFQITAIPLYVMMSRIKWVNTIHVLIIPGMVSAFGIFMMRQYMASIPDEVIDSAIIDGCGFFKIYLKIMVPLVQSGLVVFGIITLMSSWNDYFWPLIMVQNDKLFTVTLRLAAFAANMKHIEYGAILAGSFISSLPMIIIFIIFRNKLLEGLISGSFR